MKNTLEITVKAAAAKAHTAGKTSMKHPVSSILSLCVLGVCSATLITFSQTSDQTNDAGSKVELSKSAPRTFTSTDGKTIVARLVDKTADSVTVIRMADSKRVDIPLDRLCDSDQDLIKSWDPSISNYKPSSVSIAGSSNLQRGSYPSAYQPRYSTGGARIDGGSGHVTTTAKKSCRLVSVRVITIPGSCPTPCK